MAHTIHWQPPVRWFGHSNRPLKDDLVQQVLKQLLQSLWNFSGWSRRIPLSLARLMLPTVPIESGIQDSAGILGDFSFLQSAALFPASILFIYKIDNPCIMPVVTVLHPYSLICFLWNTSTVVSNEYPQILVRLTRYLWHPASPVTTKELPLWREGFWIVEGSNNKIPEFVLYSILRQLVNI